jgi:threonine/homoserine/homoserine lactone efflux protein
MRDLALIIVIASIAYLAWIAWMCRNAPHGWEDPETGFHFGEPGDDQ